MQWGQLGDIWYLGLNKVRIVVFVAGDRVGDGVSDEMWSEME